MKGHCSGFTLVTGNGATWIAFEFLVARFRSLTSMMCVNCNAQAARRLPFFCRATLVPLTSDAIAWRRSCCAVLRGPWQSTVVRGSRCLTPWR